MLPQQPGDPHRWKEEIRTRALAGRRDQSNKGELSRLICDEFSALVEYAQAATVMCYVDAHGEVRTRGFLPAAIAAGKRVVVPYCVGDSLGLFRLESMDELQIGAYNIPEPKPELRLRLRKQVDLCELDLVMVPGVAFDRRGGRTGHGKGYYDRLLAGARADSCLVGLAFECQVFDEVPMTARDVHMDKVISERAVYLGRGRPAAGG